MKLKSPVSWFSLWFFSLYRLCLCGSFGLATNPADPPALLPGKWALVAWPAPLFPVRMATLTIGEKDGRPAVTAVEGDFYEGQAKGLAVSGRRVRISLSRDGAPDDRFEGLLDPADPTRIVGSFENMGVADRAVLQLARPGRPANPPRPEPPAEYQKWLELDEELRQAEAKARQSAREGPAAEGSARTAAEAVRQRVAAEGLQLLRKLAAEQADNAFGYDAVQQLFFRLELFHPAPAEIEFWTKVIRPYAAAHGPQLEAGMLGRLAGRLIRQVEYAGQARGLAAEADKIAADAGLPAFCIRNVAWWDEERAAWASLPNPPAAGATWTVTLTGQVTDARGAAIPDATVQVGGSHGASVHLEDPSKKVTTGPDGHYAITLKCEGTFRAHVALLAEKRGFVRAVSEEQHNLLPGQTATVDFKLTPGELFGGTLKARPTSPERDFPNDDVPHLLRVTGPGVEESMMLRNGEKFERTLPPGAYTVELTRGGVKRHAWTGFKTGTTDYVFEEPPFQFTPETVGAGFDELWKAMDQQYSYFTFKPDVDWAKLRDEYRPKAIRAKSAEELTAVLKDMLGRLRDGHVWIITPSGEQVGSHRAVWTYNGNRDVIRAQLTDTTVCGEYAIVGKTKADGFGYFLMTRQSAATPELVAKATAAIEKLADAPGFVIDLRNANGGSEPLAQDIARLFCGQRVVYAKSRLRNGPGHDEFTDDIPRELPAAKSGRPYLKPVVCLLGPACVSSGEGFAKMLAALPHVTTIGLPTRGSSGNPAPVKVGDTGLMVYFSRWVDLLPDGTPIEGKGVPPAVRVEALVEAYKVADPTLVKGLEVLKAHAKAQRR